MSSVLSVCVLSEKKSVFVRNHKGTTLVFTLLNYQREPGRDQEYERTKTVNNQCQCKIVNNVRPMMSSNGYQGGIIHKCIFTMTELISI